MKNLKKLVCLLLALVMVFSFAACGEKKQAEEPVEEKKDGPVYGGTLIVSREGAMTEQDWYPHMKLNTTAKNLTMNPALEQLFFFDKDGKMMPQLAKSWDVSADNLVWTFHLVENAKFHDGTPFNADAAIWNLNAAKEAAAEATTSNGDMVSAEKVDENTVKVTFSSMYATLLLNFDSYMYSPDAFEKNGLEWAAKNPVGTGAFKFDHLTFDSEMVYVKNEDYWGVDKDGNKLPYLDGVTFKIIANETVLGASYQAGEVDAISNANSSDLCETLMNTQDSTRLTTNGVTIFHSLMPNAANGGPLADPKVRQALSYAIDLDTIISSVCDPELYHASNQYELPGNLFYNKDIKGCPYDVEKAKALLKEAGYGEGGKKLSVTIVTESVPAFVTIDQAVQAYLIDAGVDCEVLTLEGAAYLEKCILNPWEENWIVDMATTLTAYCPLTGIARLMGANNAKYFPAVGFPQQWTDSIVASAAAPTLEKAVPDYQAANKFLFDEDFRMLGVWTIGGAIYVKNNVHNYTLDYQTPQFSLMWKDAK